MTSLTTRLFTLILVATSSSIFAQPQNDDCGNAIHLDIASSEATAIKLAGDTRNTVDEKGDSIPVCSANFYRDAVWYKFIAPDTVPSQGMSIKLYFGELVDDIEIPGVALYSSCEGSVDNQPLFCKNNPDGDRLFFGRYCPDLKPGETYYVRVWSASGTAADWTLGWGTFRIAAFVNDPVPEALDVIWDGGGFNGGLNGWTVEGIQCGNDANQNPVDSSFAKWTWAIGGLTKGNLWGGQQIASETGCLGAMVFDSDYMDNGGLKDNFGKGPCPTIQEATLTSPLIDLSVAGMSEVSLLFYQQIQHFESKYFVEYTFDDSIWTSIDLTNILFPFNPGFPPGNANMFKGPFEVKLPVVDVKDQLRIRFRCIGEYYFWMIDDVQIISGACQNLQVKSTCALPANRLWHVDQLHDFPVWISLHNRGACAVFEVTCKVELVTEAGDVLAVDSIDIAKIQVDEVRESGFADECLFHENLSPGNYFLRYSARSKDEDLIPADNSLTFPFSVTSDLMAKESEVQNAVSYHPGESEDSLNWAIGNVFFIPNGDGFNVCEIDVGIGNANALVPSVTNVPIEFDILVYTWADENYDGDIDLEDEALLVGKGKYQFKEEDAIKMLFAVPITDLNTNDCLMLTDSTDYLIIVRYFTPDDPSVPLDVLFNPEYDYSGNRSASLPYPIGKYLCRPTYAEFINVGLTDNIMRNGISNFSAVPVIRMNLDKVDPFNAPVNSEELLVMIHPNPVQDMLIVDIDFIYPLDPVYIRISDITGKSVMTQNLSGMQQSTWTHNVSHLANGSYFLYVTTPQGVRTEKFVIQH